MPRRAVHPICQYRANGAVPHREQKELVLICLGLIGRTGVPNCRRRGWLHNHGGRRSLIGNDQYLWTRALDSIPIVWTRRGVGIGITIAGVAIVPIAAVIPIVPPQEG